MEFGEGVEDISEASGYAAALMRIVQARLNFTSTIMNVKGFGSVTKNGTWNGMVGVLARHWGLPFLSEPFTPLMTLRHRLQTPVFSRGAPENGAYGPDLRQVSRVLTGGFPCHLCDLHNSLLDYWKTHYDLYSYGDLVLYGQCIIVPAALHKQSSSQMIRNAIVINNRETTHRSFDTTVVPGSCLSYQSTSESSCKTLLTT
ncbi:hypothetical protein Pcinc_008370 [Petrolisthes cinctipes]|uniref:Uncharacterized protein n=1 Tax=Petrolisthes cinctipes TaxID=88211 RepID=A0AAE1G960_PETCI|nr:hypothetical protein Pcinc_008370 [Petrolisthes cinctipes]